MQPGSTPLRRALAETQKAGAHPDADQLNAFAEGQLMTRERENVLAHLAVCAECREISRAAAAAAPGQEVRDVAESSVHPRWTAGTRRPVRRWYPWAAVAACLVAVCAAVLVHREQKLSARPVQDIHASLNATPNPTEMVASSQPAQAAPAPAAEQKRKVARPAAKVGSGHGYGMAGNRTQHYAAAPVPESAPMASESVTVQADSAPTAASAPAQMPQVSEAVPDTTRAKRGPFFAGAAGAMKMSRAVAPPLPARWRINEQGQVERAVGEGDWQPMLSDDRLRLRTVSVVGTEVWVGGQGLRLYRSPDGGQTWSQVPVAAKGNADSIEHIRFETPQNGTIEADSGATWTTTDGGKTWN